MPPRAAFHEHRGQVRQFFREWREHKGLTQDRLAERLETTKTRVSMKERGLEGWDDGYLAALADALGVADPVSLLIRNPLEPDAPWSLIEGLTPANREKALDYIRLLRSSETNGDEAA